MNKSKGKFIFFTCAGILFVCTLLFQSFPAVLFLLVIFYIVHALFFTDHIYYNPNKDYQYMFGNALYFSGALHNKDFTLSKKIPSDIDSCVLPVKLTCSFLGRIFDPYVEISDGNKMSRQYFERGTCGQRFLNLSRFTDTLQDKHIKLSPHYCHIENGELTLTAFSNPDYRKKRTLIISPHADDAELAAFAFYKHAPSVFIVTVSAGEIEAAAYENITGKSEKKAAALLKGRLRAWDSLSIPLLAGPHVEAIHLGYFCMTLKTMHEQPNNNIASRATGEYDVRPFRTMNKKKLPSDNSGENNWKNLIDDLTALINEFQPEVILTPHPQMDPQPDHFYSTLAIMNACSRVNANPDFLLYANHYHGTDMYPFGPEHSDVPLPPYFENNIVAEKLFSIPLDTNDQIDKICALQMMHDLNRPTSIKKQLRKYFQRIIGRSKMPYGHDEYLRKTIRQQEIFWVSSLTKMKKDLNI